MENFTQKSMIQIPELLGKESGGATDEQIASAVEAYMKENPVSQPTKLSDLENDLWYTKNEHFLTLHKEDFIARYMLDDNGDPTDEIECYYYKGTPKLNWLTSVGSFDFELTAVNPETGEAEVFTKANTEPWFFEGPFAFGESFAYSDGFPMSIMNGCDFNEDPEDAYYVGLHVGPDALDVIVSLVIYKVDEKKIPIEYCDTSEIEAEIDEINGEVV